MEVKPTTPVGPRIFEKLYTLAMANAEDPAALAPGRGVGLRVRRAGAGRGADELQAGCYRRREAYKNVRALFGGRSGTA